MMGCISSLQYIFQVPEDTGHGYAAVVLGTLTEEQVAGQTAA
jgi:hypothetical protein